MAKAMLGRLPLSVVQGPRDALEQRLAGNSGEEWLQALNMFLRKENPWPRGAEIIPRLSSAPRDSYRTVELDGNPYEFLLKHYELWLLPGRECLDRSTLNALDSRLLKELQKLRVANHAAVPSLSEVFPSTAQVLLRRRLEGI